MKKLIFWNFVLLFALLAAFAGDAVPVPAAGAVPAAAGEANNLALALIPVLVPLLVALGKWALPKVPLWLLPILAPALGALVDYLSTLATGAVASPLLGAALGSAGVGVREIYDQASRKLKGNPTVPLVFLMAALPAATITVGVSGCAYFRNTPTEAVVFHTFKDSWDLSKTAYDGWSERVVMGKISKENSDEVDKVWNNYRAAFRSALLVARQDWNAVTPDNLRALQNQLLSLIATLSQ